MTKIKYQYYYWEPSGICWTYGEGDALYITIIGMKKQLAGKK